MARTAPLPDLPLTVLVILRDDWCLGPDNDALAHQFRTGRFRGHRTPNPVPVAGSSLYASPEFHLAEGGAAVEWTLVLNDSLWFVRTPWYRPGDGDLLADLFTIHPAPTVTAGLVRSIVVVSDSILEVARTVRTLLATGSTPTPTP